MVYINYVQYFVCQLYVSKAGEKRKTKCTFVFQNLSFLIYKLKWFTFYFYLYLRNIC